MTDWCPENDGAYRAEMAAMYPVQNRKRIDELENIVEELADKLAQAVWRLEQMRDDQTAYRHVSHFRRGAAVTLSALEENK